MSDSPATPTAPILPETWVNYIGPFAATIGKPVDAVTILLQPLVGEAGDQAIELLQNRDMTPDAEIKALLNGTPGAIANKAIGQLRAAPVAASTTASMGTVASLDVLPVVPNDETWLASLKVGGVLKFNRETVIGTVSAALASKVGLYDLPKRIVDAMEAQAQTLEEPVGSDFYTMQRTLTERSYADIFAAIPGATGRYATEGRKRELLAKINTNLWGALIAFQEQLNGWFDSWQKTMANPAMMFSAIASMAGGGGMLPQGMMQPPPTEPMRDAAESVITSINRIFAGTGIPVAMALAYDAQQIRQALENPALPIQVGAANREQMLRLLGVAVTSDYPRLEQNVKRYTLGIIELPNVTSGQPELAYLTALYQLGAMIPWSKLNETSEVGGRTGIGKTRPDRL